MEGKYKNLPLRNGVGIVVLNKENKVFVAKRIDNKNNFWQMPQGGVDKGEDFYEAALRFLAHAHRRAEKCYSSECYLDYASPIVR